MPTIQVTGLKELTERMAQFPVEYDRASEVAMKASLLTLQESVPAYPPQPYSLSPYERTGLLGRSLGVGQTGGVIGSADVYKAEKVGGGWRGEFGSNVEYAPRVIGEAQSEPWKSYWWNIETVKKAAEPKVQKIWELLAEKLAQFLDSKG